MISSSKPKLNPCLWCVVRQLPNMQQIVLGRYRKRAEADGHLALLRQQMPHGSFAIIFDAPPVDRSPSSG